MHSQQGLSGFYEEQSALLLQNLRRAEESLSEFSLREGIVSPTAEIQAAVTSVSQHGEPSCATATRSSSAPRRSCASCAISSATQPEVVKRVQQLEVNPVVRQLREHLVDREVDRVALLRKYTENDRHVRDNQTEIDELSSRSSTAPAASEPMSVSSETFAANPVYEARLSAAARTRGQAAREPRPQAVARGGSGARRAASSCR